MKGNMEERACALAAYIIENRATVRAAAKKFGVSKSTVHKDLQDRLPQFNRSLYLQVKEVLEVNKAQRHIRGGMATRKKYKGFCNFFRLFASNIRVRSPRGKISLAQFRRAG